MLLDSGFSGFAVVGALTLERHLDKFLSVKDVKSLSKCSYTFGAGKQYSPVKTVLAKHPKFSKEIRIDVVEGQLPFLLGRAFLRTHRGVLDFRKDTSSLNGIKSNGAHQVPLSSLGGEEPDSKHRVSFNGETANQASDLPTSNVSSSDTPPDPSKMDQSKSDLDQSATKGKESVSESCGGVTEVYTGSMKKKFQFNGRHDCACCDINLYTALNADETFPEREVEDAILRAWLGSGDGTSDKQQGNGNRPPSEQLPPVRERSGNEPLLPTEKSVQLSNTFPSPIWFITSGLIRRLHMMRHSPAAKIVHFIRTAVPARAMQKQGSYPAVKDFLRNVQIFAEHVVKKCIGCTLNGTEVHRPISLSVVPPFAIGMVDTMCLDYSQRWYALVVSDLGTGMCWAYPITGRYPPDGPAVFATYITDYAAAYGPHKVVVTDRDAIFSGNEATLLWQQLGVERDSTGSFAHFSLGAVERKIGMFRWAIDRIRVETPPRTMQAWKVVLSTIGNQFFNEEDMSKTTPSMRVFGRSTSLLRNVLTDTLVTATGENEHLEAAENALKVYQEAKADRKLRRMLATKLPKGLDTPVFPKGKRVAVYRENVGSRGPNYTGPASVIGFEPVQQKYILEENGGFKYVDRVHVREWPENDPADLRELATTTPAPISQESAPDEEMQLTGSHPMDRVDPPSAAPRPEGLDVRSLIHDPTVPDQRKDVTCGRCLGRNQKHAHLREPGCLEYKPDDPKSWSNELKLAHGYSHLVDPNYKRRGGGKSSGALKDDARQLSKNKSQDFDRMKHLSAEQRQAELLAEHGVMFADGVVVAGDVVATMSTRASTRRNRKQKQLAANAASQTEPLRFDALTAEHLAEVMLLASDLQNEVAENLDFVESQLESVYLTTPDGDVDVSESKYLYRWEDLSAEQQKTAYLKAISAYDQYKSWNRGTELTDHQMKELRKTSKNEVTCMDCTLVRDAKIKEKKLVGKVRIAPRGFKDTSFKSQFYSTSPTVSSISIRICELIGMMLGLTSWIFDVSDAFFSGEELREDEVIYIKLPEEILRMEQENGLGGDPSKPWRRLRREVPGCRGASSSWFRVLTKKLESWGYEQTTTDSALFVKREAGRVVGILPIHVDDGKLRATEKEAKWLFQKFKEDSQITLSSIEKQNFGEPVEFCGLQYVEDKTGTTINQDLYVKNKLEHLDVTHLRSTDPEKFLEGQDVKTYGTTVGRLIWLLPTQLKQGFEISFLSRYRAYPRTKHFRRIAAVVKAIKSEPGRIFLPRFHQNAPLRIITIVDAAQGEEADSPLKTRDHQCVMTLLCSTVKPDQDSLPPGSQCMCGIISYSSSGVSRVSHASFDFEAIAAVSSIDLLVNVKELVGEVILCNCPPLREKGKRLEWRNQLAPTELHTDSMGLVKATRLGLVQSLTSRRRRDVLDLRDCLSSGDISTVLHVDGKTNPADTGTKKSDRTQEALPILLGIAQRGLYFPHPSSDYLKTFT